MKRYSLILFALCLVYIYMGCSMSQKKEQSEAPEVFGGYVELPRTAKNMEGFIPDRWELVKSCTGDLNKDGLSDMAFVLQSKDTISRILGIAFWEEEIGEYRLVEQKDSFVLPNASNNASKDPFREMDIRENGTLYFHFYSLEDWGILNSSYIFRYQNDRFELIGQELTFAHRATHDSWKESINYSTGQATYTTKDGNDSSETRETAATFTMDMPITLKSIGMARFDVEIDLDYDIELLREREFEGFSALPESSPDLQGFIPNRWELLESSLGDLNNDGYPDLAFVLQSKDSIPAEEPDHHWSRPYYPRILGIAFWYPAIEQYNLVEQSNTFVITHKGDGTMDEPFVQMIIQDNGTLRFDFRYWYSAGTWYMGGSTYIFRYQNDQFELIGQELHSMHRATHESTGISINYSTRKAIISTQEDGESPKETKNISFECEVLPTFESIGEASFVPEVSLE